MVSVWIKRIVLFFVVVAILCITPQTVSATASDQADELDFSFRKIWETVCEILWGEFLLLRQRIPTLVMLMILIGIKNCMDFPISLNRTVHLGIFCALALGTGELFRQLAQVAEDCILHLSEFIYMSVPILTGLVANSGRVLSAAKSTYFILGFMTLLTFLIKNIFFPGILVYFMCTVLSPLLEKDYFTALKKTILWAIKTVLPILIGIFMTVFTLLTSVTKASDSLTLQSAKMALGTCIPFLGGSLSDSGEYLIQAISQMKAKAGLGSVIGISYVFLSPLLKLIAGLVTFRILSVCAGFLADGSTAVFFEDTATSLGMLTGVVATVLVIGVLGILVLTGI